MTTPFATADYLCNMCIDMIKGIEKAKLKANLREEELVSKLEVASTSHRMSSGGADADVGHVSTDASTTILMQYGSPKVVVSTSYMW